MKTKTLPKIMLHSAPRCVRDTDTDSYRCRDARTLALFYTEAAV